MSTSEPIEDLMLRWESARQQGKKLTADELCAEAPHLLDELRKRIRAVLAMENILGVTNHDPRQTQITPHGSDEADEELQALPTIPGYQMIRVIDQGGMGIVYEARQIELGRTVAIKMISGLRLRPKLVARFRAEAESAARLQHPNFVQIFEIGQVNGRPFFSMEYVDGGSLAGLAAKSPLSARQAAEMIETLALAVHAAHERGIIHRDLKPANVMLTSDGRPKIADFGLAKRLDDDSDHTHTGEVLGTPSYMAPEQAEGKKNEIGPATDVYALGAVLYELLAGRPVFQGTSPLDSLRRVVNEEPAAPSQFAASLPRDLEAICLKCLEKSANHRYESAQALAADLRRFLDGQPVSARRIGSIQRIWKGLRRHPKEAGLVATLAVLLLIPAVLLIGEIRTHQQVRRKAIEQAPLVREILQRNCHECHGKDPRKIEGDLVILDHEHLLDSVRRIVVPGNHEDSLLMQRIADGSMPPEKEELRLPRLTEAELGILKDWIVGGAPPLPAADPERPALSAAPYSELAAQTKVIFKNHCYECHNYKDHDGGIKIFHHRLLLSVRKVVIPGDAEKSKLYKLITNLDDKKRMPPAGYDPLPKADIDTIRRWIDEGAAPFPKSE